MALRFKTFTIEFNPGSGGRRQGVTVVNFSESIIRADAALKGFDAHYTAPGSDRDFRQLHIDVDVLSVEEHAVNVRVNFDLRDASGHFDDPYAGFVQGLVIAEV